MWIVQDPQFKEWDRATDLYYISELLGMPVSYYLSHRRLALWHSRGRTEERSVAKLATRLLAQYARLEPYQVLTEDTLKEYRRAINRSRPIVIWSFASPLFELARFVKRANLPVHRPQFIISSVEMMYPHMRATIEEVFRCPVYDYYGSVEAGRTAAQCRHGSYHVFTFNNTVEVLDWDGAPVAPGQEGRLVITPLHNPAMPLIRYDIGDMACRGTSECTCGSPLPVLDRITGRVIEHFVTIDGELVYGGNFIAMFYEHDWMAEFQVLQEDVDLIKVFYKCMAGRMVPPGAIEGLNGRIRRIIGSSCRIEWHEVDGIPGTPVGKHLHARSLVWEARQ